MDYKTKMWSIQYQIYRDNFGDNDENRFYNVFNKYFLNKNSSIIDIGCGRGDLINFLINKGFTNIIGVDINKDLWVYPKYRHLLYTQDIKDMNIINNADIIICQAILHHLPLNTTLKFIGQCKDILNNNGVILLSEPNNTFITKVLFYCLFTPLRYISKYTYYMSKIHKYEYEEWQKWFKNKDIILNKFKREGYNILLFNTMVHLYAVIKKEVNKNV